jgi:IS30 family transposase
MAEHGSEARVKNGPALAGHGAEAVRDAIAATITTLPEQLRRSLTWDQGAEMAYHQQIAPLLHDGVFFAHPGRPWQRGTNENTNRLLRQYFPKGTTLAGYTQVALNKVAQQLNERPRKTLGFRSPADILAEALH